MEYKSTKVDNNLRRTLGLTYDEYCLIDYVSHGHRSLSEIAEMLGISKSGASQMVARLSGKGYLSRRKITDAEAMIKITGGFQRAIGCIACGAHSNLHRHHYPIRREHGGNKTVKLCSDCHSEFHILSDHGILQVSIDWNPNNNL